MQGSTMYGAYILGRPRRSQCLRRKTTLPIGFVKGDSGMVEVIAGIDIVGVGLLPLIITGLLLVLGRARNMPDCNVDVYLGVCRGASGITSCWPYHCSALPPYCVALDCIGACKRPS